MSADNGYVVRQREDKLWVMQMYFMSNDEYPPIDNGNDAAMFCTPEDALAEYERWEDAQGFVSEYGLTILFPENGPADNGPQTSH